MTVLFQDNFSTLSNWLLAGTPTLQPSIFTGKNALFCKPYDYADKQFNPLASVYTEDDFYYDTPLVPGQQVIFIHYQGPNGADHYVDFNRQITSDSQKVFSNTSLTVNTRGTIRIWAQTVSADTGTLRILVFKL